MKDALETLKGKPKVKRTMWSRRAQEYEAKINSGDLTSIAEVTRDLFRADDQPEQSYSERQIFEAASSRLARELGAMEQTDEKAALVEDPRDSQQGCGDPQQGEGSRERISVRLLDRTRARPSGRALFFCACPAQLPWCISRPNTARETVMKRAIALGMAAAAMAAAGCTEARSENGGPVVDRNYQVGEFDRIELAGPYDATVRTGSAISVHARGNQKAIDNLEVVVEDGALVIRPKKKMTSAGARAARSH